MKILSIIVPCYNSEGYMRKCIDSLLPGGEDVEILIVNDGSKDGTKAVADEYQAEYPGIVKAVHQENAGHGGAINTGLKNASGYFLKVVDSDDWVDLPSYEKILETLKKLYAESPVDMVLSNYVYEKLDRKYKMAIRYTGVIPEERVLTWSDMHRFPKGKYILMHSIIYRTELLRECGLELPKHTFYVDNLFAFIPLTLVKTIYYLNVDFYRYFIGREGQSVQEKKMIAQIDQQIKVNRLMASSIDWDNLDEPRKRQYMFNYFEIITAVTSVMLIRSQTEENLEKKKQLWEFIKAQNEGIYNKLRYGFLGQLMNLPGKAGRRITIILYKMSQKVVGFN